MVLHLTASVHLLQESTPLPKMQVRFLQYTRSSDPLPPASWDVQMPHNFHWNNIILHHSVNPVQHHSDKTILIKSGNKALVLLCHIAVDALFFHHIGKQLIGQLIQIVFQLVPLHGAVDIHDKGFIFQHSLKNLAHPSCHVSYVFLSCSARFPSSRASFVVLTIGFLLILRLIQTLFAAQFLLETLVSPPHPDIPFHRTASELPCFWSKYPRRRYPQVPQ